jgi:type VI secretion system protein ImpL
VHAHRRGPLPVRARLEVDVLPDDYGQLFGVGACSTTSSSVALPAWSTSARRRGSTSRWPTAARRPGGASLADFQRALSIKEAFFRAGGKVPGFKVDLRVLEMTEGMKDLTLDIDGRPFKFVAGNTAAQTVSWPSPRVASQIKLGRRRRRAAGLRGAVGAVPLFSKFENRPSPQPEKFTVILCSTASARRWRSPRAAPSIPLRMREMQTFRCPDSL